LSGYPDFFDLLDAVCIEPGCAAFDRFDRHYATARGARDIDMSAE
jgi:hypothetical protein